VKTRRVSPHLQQARAHGEDGFQLPAGFLGERLRCLLLDERRQQDALHVVDHEQRGLLA
jgi:hypothetical protein